MPKTPKKHTKIGVTKVVSPSIKELLAAKKKSTEKMIDTKVEVIEYGTLFKKSRNYILCISAMTHTVWNVFHYHLGFVLCAGAQKLLC